MVAIVTGPGTGANGAGITNSSAFVLGSRGQLGSAAFGQDGSDVYVNAANGNLAINRTDEFLIGQGPDSDFGINIDSLGSINYSPVSVVSGLTGTVNTAGSTVKRTDWDQTITTYTWDASRSAYVSTAGGGAYNTLTYSTSTSTWTWKDGSTQTTITYGSNSRPAQETDANGNSLTFSYNGNLLSRITTSDGEHTDFTYSGTQVTKVTTTLTGGAALTRVYYAYDGSGRLSTVTTDLSPSDNSITDGKKIVTTYTYDGTSNRVASIAQTGGALLQITYDTSSRVKTLTQTLANGDTTGATFVYNSGYTSITDQDGQTTTVHFDSNGQLTKLDLPLGESTSYTYDSKGNVLTATDGNGNTTTYTYDTNGNLTQSEDALGNIVDYSYDSKNNLLTTTQYTVPSGSNQPPVALNESLLVTGIGDSITFDPRLGASDPDNDPLTITAVSTPSHGTAVIHSGSSITYTRTSAGSDSFTYTISDGNGHTVTATITIADSAGSTNHAPTAGNVTATVAGAGSSLTFDPRGSDSDADGDALTITSVSTPSLGTATIVNGGTAIKYTRSGSGSDSFTYTISDGHGHTATGYITVDDSGGGTNSAPITSADHVYGTAGQIIYFDPRANDYDPDGDPLTITAVTAPSGAIALVGTGGTFIRFYDNSAKYADLTYTVSDGQGHTSTNSVHVDLSGPKNSAPVAHDDGITVSGNGTALTFNPLANDGDIDRDTLTITAVTSASHGTAVIVGGTQIKYTRSSSGTDSFTYTISDGNGHTATATVTVSDPVPANQAPVAKGDTIYVNGIGDSQTFNPRLNDSDFDTDSLTITAVSTPSHGTVTINSAASITYTRTSAGSDSFTYTISDGHGHTSNATVTVVDMAPVTVQTTNQAPTANAVTVDVPGTGTSLIFDPRASDSDPEGDALTIISISAPLLGTAEIINNGTAIRYTRAAGGSDSLTYTVSDGHGHTATGYITIDEEAGSGTNSAPVTTADHAYGSAGQIMYFDPRANDYDPDGDPLTITSVTAPSGGIALVGGSGTYIMFYDNSAKYANLNYTISDGQGHTSTNSIRVDLTGPKNSAPVAHNDGIVVSGTGASLTFDPLANDGDIDRDALTITAVTSASHGTAAIVSGGSEIKYTRSSAGTDSFTYTISDGNGHTATATVTVSDPIPTNQAPVAVGDNIVVDAIGDFLTYDPRVNDADLDADTLTITSVSTPSHGTVSIVDSGSRIKYTRTGAGDDSFTYTISDGHGHTKTATVKVTNAKGAPTPSAVLTTRYAYDTNGNLRFVVSAEGEVTEYKYNSAGEQTSSIIYRDSIYNLSGLGASNSISESSLETWASGITDKSTVERIDTTYDFRGNISTVTTYSAVDSSGNGLTSKPYTTVTYIYDQYGNLLHRQTSGIANSEVYVYDGLGRIVSSTDLNNATTTIGYVTNDTNRTTTTTVTLANGLVKTSIYNAAGLLVSYQESGSGITTATTTYKYDDLGRLRMVTDPDGNTTYYLYDSDGRKVADIAADGSITAYGYDAGSRLISTLTYINKLSSAQLASLVDGSGDPASVSLGSVLPTASSSDIWNWNVYDDANRLIETVNGDGDATVYTYDGASNLISTIVYANALPSTTVNGFKTTAPTTLQIPTADSGNDEVARYFYDDDNRLIATLNADGYISQVVYNGAGEKIETIAYAYAADAGMRAEATLSQLLSNVGVSSDDRHVRYFYDDAGRLAYTLDATLVPTQFVYDGSGNIVNTVQYAGSIDSTATYTLSYVQSKIASELASNSGNRSSWAVYNYSTGNLAYSIDANGGVTGYTYDGMGEVVSQTSYAKVRATTSLPSLSTMTSWVSSNAGSGDRATHIFYDQQGNAIYSIDPEGYVTQNVYDPDGRITDTIRYAAQYATNGSVTLSTLQSLSASHPSSAIDTRYTYDADGRVASQTVGYGSAEAATTRYTYDGAGNVTSVTDPKNNVGYSFYDAAGRTTLQIDAQGYATGTAYTSTGEIASVTHYATAVTGTIHVSVPPTVTTNADDATTTFAYDLRGQLIGVTDAEGHSESYRLDAFGDRVGVTNKLGATTTNVFDDRGLLVSETIPMVSTNPNGTVEATAVTNTYQYDAFGNRTQMVEASGLSEQRTTNYTYDKLNRLTNTSHDNVSVVANDLKTVTTVTPAEANVYDAFGNVIQTTDAAGAKTFFYYDRLGRKTAQVNAVGMLSTFTYDEDGNVLSQKVYGDPVTLPGSAGGTPPSPVNSSNYRETDYTYDHLDRLVTTTVQSLLTGSYGTSYATSTGNITLTNYYDINGNVICQTDGNNNSVWFYYDKNNRKIAEVDQNLYLTTYTLDADGNVVTETRRAIALTTAPGVPPSSTVPSVSANGDDRITDFTYDKNGNRLTETRRSVAIGIVNTSNGALTTATQSATVIYTYNGLGEVISKTEATGDYTDYVYDQTGRQTSVQGTAFTDYNGHWAQPVTDEYYDGLNNLTRTVQEGNNTIGNPDRVTTYTYGAGGRLASVTDASGFTTNYAYDADGRVVKTSYNRLKSDGTTVTEAQATRYDALGRAVFQAAATYNGTSWAFGDQTQVQYDTYGEVTARGVNGLWQQTYSYDSGGRMWRAVDSDGTVHLYIYDGNGKQTLDITSDGNALPTGYSWATLTVANAIALLTNNGAHAIGTAAVSGMVVTISTYDDRGQNLATIAPLRQLSGNATAGYVTQTITTSHTYNAFGEIVSDTDGKGNTTNYTYNTEGKLVQTQHPSVSYTSENGAIASARPTEHDYYDLSGRLVATTDANGNTNTRLLQVGTGYGGADAAMAEEFHPDTGIVVDGYDVFGELRKVTNELSNVETFGYDAMGRMTSDNHEGILTDSFAYDGLGQRIQTWNSQLGASVKSTTDYDAQGRVVKMVDMGGNVTTYAYAWSSAIATTGFGTFGGWTKTTVNSTGLTETQKVDYFGRQAGETDFGGHVNTYTFNLAGELASFTNSSNAGAPETYSYFNTGLLASQGTVTSGTYAGYDYTSSTAETYAYDANGNRTSEANGTTLTVTGLGTQTTLSHTATTTYDAMNRMTSFTDTGTNGNQGTTAIPPATVTWEYDLNGNIRHMVGTYYALDSQGNISTTSSTQDYWYKYDALNRFVTTMGTFTGTRGSGTISRGTTGQDITYDLAGNRATSTDNASGTTTYTYTADGRVDQVKIAGVLRADYTYDAMGRVTDYKEYATNGTSVDYENRSTYDNKSQLTQSVVTTIDTSNTTTVTTTTYAYNLETAPGSRSFTSTYEGGTVTDTYTTTTVNGSSTNQPQDLSYTFTWWEAPKVNWSYYYVTQSGGYSQWGNSYGYDWQGNLKSGSVGGGNPYNFNYTYNTDNQITRRDQSYGSNATNVHEVHYYFNGMAIGDISNNGSSNVDYAQSLANHRAVQGSGPFQNGATSGTTYANFDQSYDAINGQNYQNTSSLYTVQAGDTLQSIAYRLWGDSSFWYLIADANGMTSDQTLVAGQDLVIPDKVHNVHNNADTYQVYDPNKAQGAHIPTPPKPQPQDSSGSNCGIFGAIIVVVIAVVVSVLSYGTLSGPMASLAGSIGFSTGAAAGAGVAAGSAAAIAGGIAAGAVAGALGAVVSQGVAMALGIQNKFDWGGVAIGAIGGAVSGGLGSISALGEGLDASLGAFGAGAVRGVLGSVISQGIDVATGLQKKFDWAGVAAAGIGGGIGNAVGKQVSTDHPTLDPKVVHFASGAAGAIAAAATRSLITGTDFGDNLIAVLPSVIGNTIGEFAEERINGTGNTAGSQSSGSQTSAQQSSTQQTADDVNAAISQPAASAAAAGQPVSQANAETAPLIVVDLSQDPRYFETATVTDTQMTDVEKLSFDIGKIGWWLTVYSGEQPLVANAGVPNWLTEQSGRHDTIGMRGTNWNGISAATNFASNVLDGYQAINGLIIADGARGASAAEVKAVGGIINDMTHRLSPVGYLLNAATDFSAAQAQVQAGTASPVQAYTNATGKFVSSTASTESGAWLGAEIGAETGPAAPVASPVLAIAGAILGDKVADLQPSDDVKVLLPFLMLPDIIHNTVVEVGTTLFSPKEII